jgi:hypothetical protein
MILTGKNDHAEKALNQFQKGSRKTEPFFSCILLTKNANCRVNLVTGDWCQVSGRKY